MTRLPHVTAIAACYILPLALTACTSFTSLSPANERHREAPVHSSAALTSTVGDLKTPRSIVREQEARLLACAQERTCDRAHFIRALLLLPEHQDHATRHFQEVMAIAPKSALATLSVSWLRLMNDPKAKPGREAVLLQTTQWLINDLLSREQAFKDELNSRGAKLEDVSAQLEALKKIDLEMSESPNPLRPRTRVNLPSQSN